MMKCPNCGYESENAGYCPSCGAPMKEPRIHINKDMLKKIFPRPCIVACVVWALCCVTNISQIVELGFFKYIGTVIIGLALVIAIADGIIYYKKRSKNANQHRPREIETRPIYDLNKPFDNMEGHEFEYFCADILKKCGFLDVEVTRGSGDQGIDIIAYRDGVKYGIQCKCYASDIGNKAVQEAFAGKTFYHCHVAAVLTNRHFTRSAKELAETNGVLLWDREKLEELINAAAQ